MSDTQDEAERYVEEQYPESPIEVIIGISQAFKAGYRAGVATVADKHLELATKYSDLAGKYEKLVEHRNRILDGGLDRMTERDEACAELATSRAEVEQLNKLLKLAMNERRYYYDLLEEEQAKALKLVEAANRVLDQRWTIDSAEQKTSLFNLLTEVRAYSTDSGDGEK